MTGGLSHRDDSASPQSVDGDGFVVNDTSHFPLELSLLTSKKGQALPSAAR